MLCVYTLSKISENIINLLETKYEQLAFTVQLKSADTFFNLLFEIIRPYQTTSRNMFSNHDRSTLHSLDSSFCHEGDCSRLTNFRKIFKDEFIGK